MGLAQAEPNSGGKAALFATLGARFGKRFSLSHALREQHANTLTWLKLEPPDAVLFAKTTQGVSDVVRLCAGRVPVIRSAPAPRSKVTSMHRSAGCRSICRP
jgi:D-lactate dehydrogenase (cytochrome)